MENILGVTDFLREKIAAAGGDPTRETLSVIPAVDGKPYYKICSAIIGDPISLSRTRRALTRERDRSSFIRVA